MGPTGGAGRAEVVGRTGGIAGRVVVVVVAVGRAAAGTGVGHTEVGHTEVGHTGAGHTGAGHIEADRTAAGVVVVVAEGESRGKSAGQRLGSMRRRSEWDQAHSPGSSVVVVAAAGAGVEALQGRPARPGTCRTGPSPWRSARRVVFRMPWCLIDGGGGCRDAAIGRNLFGSTYVILNCLVLKRGPLLLLPPQALPQRRSCHEEYEPPHAAATMVGADFF